MPACGIVRSKRSTWLLVGAIVVIATIGTLLLVPATGVAYAVGFATLSGIINFIVGSMVRPKSMAKLVARETELRRSWDELCVKGKLLYYPEWVGKRFVLVGFLLAGFFVFLAVVLAVAIGTNTIPASPSQNRSFLEGFAVIAALFLFLPWVVFVQCTKTGHEASSTGIRKGSPWSRSFFVTWDEIESVKYRFSTDSYIIRTTKGTIRMRALLDGVTFFLQLVSENVPPEKTKGVFDRRKRYTI